jgi:hypothetical protein
MYLCVDNVLTNRFSKVIDNQNLWFEIEEKSKHQLAQPRDGALSRAYAHSPCLVISGMDVICVY